MSSFQRGFLPLIIIINAAMTKYKERMFNQIYYFFELGLPIAKKGRATSSGKQIVFTEEKEDDRKFFVKLTFSWN